MFNVRRVGSVNKDAVWSGMVSPCTAKPLDVWFCGGRLFFIKFLGSKTSTCLEGVPESTCSVLDRGKKSSFGEIFSNSREIADGCYTLPELINTFHLDEYEEYVLVYVGVISGTEIRHCYKTGRRLHWARNQKSTIC